MYLYLFTKYKFCINKGDEKRGEEKKIMVIIGNVSKSIEIHLYIVHTEDKTIYHQ